MAMNQSPHAASTPAAPPPRPPLRKQMVRWTGYLLIRLVLAAISLLPAGGTRALGALVGNMACRLARGWWRVATRNLETVYPDWTPEQRADLIRRCFRHFGTSAVEFLRLPRMSEAELEGRVRVEGMEHMDAALALGKGVVMITAHLGNWEFIGATLTRLGYPVDAIARDPELKQTAELLRRTRLAKGMQRVYPRGHIMAAVHGLKENRILAILPDQHDFHGVRIDFMGHACLAAPGPASIALITRAQVVPAFSIRRPDGIFEVRFYPALPVARTGRKQDDILALTQQINNVIGEQVRQHPEQWNWFHDRWRPDAKG